MPEQKSLINRRAFVQVGAGLAASQVLPVSAEETKESKPSPMKYRELGRTKLKISEISFGTYGFSNSELLEDALDKGINMICTAAEYQNGTAEKAIGQVMKALRKNVVLMSGWRCRPNTTKRELLDSLDASLKRLQTDHLDIIKSHFVEEPEWLDNQAQYEAFEEAKKAGKVKFLGISSHGGNQEKILEKALSVKTIDVLQCKYNFMEFPEINKLFDQAKSQGVGVIVFKTGAGKFQNEVKGLEEKGLSVEQAAVRWALTHENITSVCAGITSFSQIKEMTESISKKLSRADADLLHKYAQAVDKTYCRYCSTCEPSCPHGVSVANVMRYSMYFKNYKMEKEAMSLYAKLDDACKPENCVDCPGHCIKACPHGRSVRDGLLQARSILV